MTVRTGIFAGACPFTLARTWLGEAEKTEINDPNAMALSTVDAQGMPNARVVLLKAIEDDGFVFYTNYTSAKGQEVEALKLLTEGDHNIIKHVSVENEANRPPRGPKSRPVAIQVYQLLLRTYMGSGNLDEAIKTMDELEVVAGSDNLDALTQIYIQLGFKLKEEMN